MPFYLLLFLLLYAPLAYGSTGPVALTIVEALSLLGLLWVGLEGVLGRRKLYRPPGLLPLLLLGVLMLLQALPLPPAFLTFLSPATAARYADTVWLLQPEVWMPLTLNVQRTLEAFAYYSACLAFYLFASQCLVESGRIQRVVRVLTIFAGLYALAAIFESLFPNGNTLWFLAPWPSYAGKPFGSYINGNHYAGLMGMLLPLLVMFFLLERPTVHYGRWRERLVDFCSDPGLASYLLTGFAALLTAASIFLSLSRGGFLSALGALFFLGGLLAWRSYYRRQALILLGFVVVLFFFVGLFGWEGIFANFARIRNLQGEIFDGRLSYWHDTLALFRDFPLFGSGFGSYLDAYPAYQSLFQAELVVDHAHNDYIELLADGGAVALVLALWAAVAVLRSSWQAFGRRRRQFSVSLYLGSLAGLVAILLHSITDFNLHIGANGLYFAFLAAFLVACAFTSSRRGAASELPKLSRRALFVVISLAGLCLAGGLVLNGGALLAEELLAPVPWNKLGTLKETELAGALERVALAETRAPLQSVHRFRRAQLLQLDVEPEQALQAYGETLRLRPLYGFYLQRAAAGARALQRTDLEGALLQAAARYDRADLRRLKAYADWLFRRGETAAAFVQLRIALELAPQEARALIDLMVANNVPPREMSAALPERAAAWLHYAQFLLAVQDEGGAEQAYRRAVLLMAQESLPWTAAHHALTRFLEKGGRYDEALAVLRDGIELFPGDAALHAGAGTLYERQQLNLRALEEYRQALLLNPRLEWVRKRLERLERLQ